MPSFLIGFKENNPADTVPNNQNPVAEQISASPTRYFHWQTYANPPTPNNLKEILYLIRQAYPDSSSFATAPTAVSHTIKTKFHLYESKKHYFIVKTGSFYEIHARVKAPARVTELPSAEMINAEEIDESDIESILEFYPLKKFKTFTRLDLNSGEPVIPVFTTVDENFLPAKKLLDKSKTRLTQIFGKLESGNKILEEARKLLAETKPLNSSADAEAVRYEKMLASLLPQINYVSTACLALNSKYADLENKLIELYKELMDEDDEDNSYLRHSLIGCLWACALHYAQSHIDFNFGLGKPLIEFPNLFKQIASIDNKDFRHVVLYFDPKLKSLSFTELQDLTNELLAKLYKAGGLKVYLGYQWSEQIKFLTDIIKSKLAGYAQINPQTNQFSWRWSVVSRDDETITKALKTLYHRDLAYESTKIETLIDNISTVKNEISEFNERNIATQERLTHNHSSISRNVSEAKNVTHEMKDIYAIATSQIDALQQVVQQLVVLAAQFSLPFSSIEEIITQAETLQTSMEGNLSIAQEHKTEVFVTGSIASKVEQQKQELTAKLTQLKEIVTPLTELNSHVTCMQTIINDQLPKTTSKDNLILITRKFVNMLADIEYFQSKVTWGGGTRIEGNGKNYIVQESYSKLLRAKETLTDPMNAADAVAFWSAAKTIAELAKKRGSYRYYFFKVRSDEMQALLKLIEDLDVDHIPSSHHIDKQLTMIKPDWRSKQEPSSISMRPDPSLSPSFRSSLSLSLVRSFSLSSASAAGGGDEEPEEFKLTPPPSPRLVV